MSGDDERPNADDVLDSERGGSPRFGTEGEARRRWTLTPREAARLLGISERAVQDGCRRGDLPCTRVGKLYLLPVDSLRGFLGLAVPDAGAEDAGSGRRVALVRELRRRLDELARLVGELEQA